ncbi:heterokaryon incompatibility protein [Ilyonectria robusta]
MGAECPHPQNQGDPTYHLSVDELSSPSKNYCDDCRRMIELWPWAQLNHQAVAAMEQEKCPLCKFIFHALCLKRRIHNWRHNELVVLHSWADEGDPHCEVTQLRRPITNIANYVVMTAARSWLEDCSTWHSACRKLCGDFLAQRAELPRRVLELDARDGHVRIYESKPDEMGVYATLSYVWGVENQPVTATKQVVEKARLDKDGGPWIAESSLPQALQDAVELTRHLNLKFLWIDVLCIIQDDPADHIQEMAKLLGIYKNAAICIRPANIGNIHQSFLRNKGPYSPSPVCSVHITGLGRQDVTLKFTIKENDGESDMKRYNGPLRRRSWTKAESFVSSRRITITPHNEMTYHCPAWAQGTTLNESFNKHHYYESGRLSTVMQCSELSEPNWRVENWCHLVSDVCVGEISKPEDRIEMLNSIAQDPVWEDQYMYGLWRKKARELLTWRLDGPYNQLPTRRLNQAPTWSWASTSARICYDPLKDMVNWQFRFINWMYGSCAEPLCIGPPVLATVILEGKLVYWAVFWEGHLPLLAHNVDASERFSDIQGGDLFVLLLRQLNYGPSQSENLNAAPSKGTTIPADSKHIATGSRGTANIPVASGPWKPIIASPLGEDTTPGTTIEHKGSPLDVAASLPTFGPGPKPKSRGSFKWLGVMPDALRTRRHDASSMRQGLSGSASKSARSPSLTAAATILAPLQNQEPRSLRDPLDPDDKSVCDDTVAMSPSESAVNEGPQELAWRSEGKSLISGKYVQMMILKRVSEKTFERVALISRPCEEEWISFWNRVKMEEIRLI